jgi:hypothetical protein
MRTYSEFENSNLFLTQLKYAWHHECNIHIFIIYDLFILEIIIYFEITVHTLY